MEQMGNEINELIEQSKQKAKVLTEKRDQRCCIIKTSRYETDHRTWWWKRNQ